MLVKEKGRIVQNLTLEADNEEIEKWEELQSESVSGFRTTADERHASAVN
jgi:hypothetical protein